MLAVYPWGDTAPMRWDSLRHRWFHRFLVPREIRDGDIQVLVYVVERDGRLTKRVQTMHVDGSAPELDIEVSVEDGLTTVTVYAEEPLRSVAVQPVGHPELRIRLDVPGDAFAHTIELPGLWAEVEVIAKDKAMNTIVARAEAVE